MLEKGKEDEAANVTGEVDANVVTGLIAKLPESDQTASSTESAAAPGGVDHQTDAIDYANHPLFGRVVASTLHALMAKTPVLAKLDDPHVKHAIGMSILIAETVVKLSRDPENFMSLLDDLRGVFGS